MQDYSWRSYTTPNIHSLYGIRKDILRILDSIDYLDNKKGGLWTHPELGFVVAAHMDSTPELGLVVAAHMDYPPEMGLFVAALALVNLDDQLLVVAQVVLLLPMVVQGNSLPVLHCIWPDY